MKRFKRFVSLARITDRLASEEAEPAFQSAVLASLPARVFGRTIAAHIESVSVRQGTLYLEVPDPIWRVELAKHERVLLEKARKIRPSLRAVEVVP